jgi:hypothetical protein
MTRRVVTETDIIEALSGQFSEVEILRSVNRLKRQGVLTVSQEGIRLEHAVIAPESKPMN